MIIVFIVLVPDIAVFANGSTAARRGWFRGGLAIARCGAFARFPAGTAATAATAAFLGRGFAVGSLDVGDDFQIVVEDIEFCERFLDERGFAIGIGGEVEFFVARKAIGLRSTRRPRCALGACLTVTSGAATAATTAATTALARFGRLRGFGGFGRFNRFGGFNFVEDSRRPWFSRFARLTRRTRFALFARLATRAWLAPGAGISPWSGIASRP
jgi:hypothetical protein